MGDGRLVIVCALEFERRRLARALGARVKIVCAGPGPRAITPCIDRLASGGARRVLLAGVAGGLRTTALCPPIGRVVDRSGRSWRPSLGAGRSGDAVTLLGLDEPVAEPSEKAALGVAHDASLADCESHAFAERATHHGLVWGVVRGVSDGPGERLDPRIHRWADARGRTRLGAVAGDILRDPRLIGAAWRLGRRSAGAMDAVASRVDEIIRTLERVRDG